MKDIHIQVQRRPQKDVGTSIKEPLPGVAWNIFPWKWETGPRILIASQPTGTFQISYSIFGQSELVICFRVFCRAFFFFNGAQVQKVELIIFPVHNILLSLFQERPIYLFIYSFIHSFIHSFAMYVLFYWCKVDLQYYISSGVQCRDSVFYRFPKKFLWNNCYSTFIPFSHF